METLFVLLAIFAFPLLLCAAGVAAVIVGKRKKHLEGRAPSVAALPSIVWTEEFDRAMAKLFAPPED